MNANPNQSVYVSAVDWWIALMLVLGPIICVGMTGVLLNEDRTDEALQCLLVGAGILLVTASVTVPCRYTILDETLSIRCGVMKMQIPLKDIRTIEPSRSWISGPALSLRRLKISTGSRFYLVSPADREGFVEALNAAMERARDQASGVSE